MAWPEQTLTALLAAAAVGTILLLRRRLAPSMLSPVYLTMVGYLILAVAGQLCYQRVVASGVPGAGIKISLSDAAVAQTTRLILVAAVAVAVGAALFTAAAPKRNSTAPQLRALALSRRVQRLLLAGAAGVLGVVVVSYGWANLLRRSVYLADVPFRSVYVVVAQLAMAAVLALGYLFATGRGGQRLAAVLLLSGYALVLFCTSSRRLALLPLLVVAGAAASAPQARRWRLLLPAALLASLALVRVSLYTRSLGEHGWWPYLHGMPDIAESRFGWGSVALNLLIGFAVVGKTAFDAPHIPAGDFLIAVNPLPGDLAGWYQVAPQHRLNVFTPFAALGELGNHGWPALVGYCLVAGVVLAYLDRRMRALLDHGQLYGLALVGLVGLFTVVSTQYNLRSATRMLYYAVAVDLLVRIWLAVTTRARSPEPNP